MIDINKPCIRKCCLNEDDVCLGCFRTFNDMIQWNKANIEEKTQMLKMAKKREMEYLLKHTFSQKSHP